ncbi:extracellular catalytic domain type 2 short-chain-length polyhydroxyalkanoate depolymerase [Planctobacterium marinum]|uniref:Depolymerase n=1 Tax=Planctobacterium marinum TaxID=1631968 RepID=A0AA48KP82_9ALTE|nr:depolymerase [Planctobacterium marinum]
MKPSLPSLQAAFLSTVLLTGTSLVCAEQSPAALNLGEQITVSGISSGGYMANQYHIAHSDTVAGAGIIAAGPYYCSEGNLMVAMKQCLADGSPLSEKELIAPMQQLASQASIASLANLQQDRVWLLHGTLDKRVGADVSSALALQYGEVTSNKNIRFINDKPFNHGLPTADFGLDCSVSATPFINNCDFDAATELLHWLYPQKKQANPNNKPQNTNKGTLYTLSQPSQINGRATGLDDSASLYVPKQCESGASCDLHISFHGCQQNAATIGNKYVQNSGFNAVADQLDLVVLYPQIASNNPLNPLACWDWWGYTGDDFAQRSGPQMSAIATMVETLKQSPKDALSVAAGGK